MQSAPKPPPVLVGHEARQLLTLPTWLGLTPEQQYEALNRPRNRTSNFNEQKTDGIEWAKWSWNPVTGCLHACTYCYARDIALRYPDAYPQKFAPTFLPERLSAPRNTKVPAEAALDTGYQNVFTCSMADLFGRWVPSEWIEAVLAEVHANPQWNFLFLTKFPIRLAEFEFPDNAWVGTTVDAQARVANAERAFASVRAKTKWLSCEPMLEPLTFSRLDLFQWIVVGGASRSTQTPEFRPPRPWLVHLEQQADALGIKVYEKTNLLERRREYPGQPPEETVSVPREFKMPYLQRDVLKPKVYAQEFLGMGRDDDGDDALTLPPLVAVSPSAQVDVAAPRARPVLRRTMMRSSLRDVQHEGEGGEVAVAVVSRRPSNPDACPKCGSPASIVRSKGKRKCLLKWCGWEGGA